MVDNSKAEEIFGAGFADKYKKSSKFVPRTYVISDRDKKKILEKVRAEFDGEKCETTYELANGMLDVVLVETMEEMQWRDVGTSKGLTMQYKGRYISPTMDEKFVPKFFPQSLYVLVGRMVEKTSNGKNYLNFYTHEVFTMDELKGSSSSNSDELVIERQSFTD